MRIPRLQNQTESLSLRLIAMKAIAEFFLSSLRFHFLAALSTIPFKDLQERRSCELLKALKNLADEKSVQFERKFVNFFKHEWLIWWVHNFDSKTVLFASLNLCVWPISLQCKSTFYKHYLITAINKMIYFPGPNSYPEATVNIDRIELNCVEYWTAHIANDEGGRA